MKFDDYRPLLPDNGKVNKDILDFFKLRPKFNMDITYIKCTHPIIPYVHRTVEEDNALKKALIDGWEAGKNL